MICTKRVADGDERLVEIGFGFHHAGGPQQAAVRGADDAFFDGVADGHSGDNLIKGVVLPQPRCRSHPRPRVFC